MAERFLRRFVFLLGIFAWFSASRVHAETSWPQFHGPLRDNMSRETGLLQQWPEGGPKLVWRFGGCGKGYATVSIAKGLAFTSGDFGDDEYVLAVDLAGKLKWKTLNGKAWKGPQPGSRTTPTYSEGLVYQLNAHGALTAFEARSGKVVWSVDIAERFAARLRTWGFAENLVVEDNLVLCTPGGAKGRVVALDKKTGATVWKNTEIQDLAAYGSPIVVPHQGARMFLNFMHETVVGVEVRTGKLLWTHPHASTCDQNVTSPLFQDGSVFVTSGHRGGGRRFKLEAASGKTTELWFDKNFDNCHGGVICVDDHLYFCGCRMYNKGLICVNFATGQKQYRAEEIGKVSVTYADGHLYCFGNDGEMMLVKASPQSARIVSRFTIPRNDNAHTLAHPVICDGRLYLRHLDDLLVYEVRASHNLP